MSDEENYKIAIAIYTLIIVIAILASFVAIRHIDNRVTENEMDICRLMDNCMVLADEPIATCPPNSNSTIPIPNGVSRGLFFL